MSQTALLHESISSQTAGSNHRDSSRTYRAWVARSPGQAMKVETIDAGPLGSEEVEIAVEHCGLCHSDISILNNDWGISQYPAVLGHEAVGRITALGSNTKGLGLGQRVGIGWASATCMHCNQCISGRHNLCPQAQFTIVGHRGGFASHVRAHWAWTFPIPEKLTLADAGPLLCGGVTVYEPLAMYARPEHRVGVLGIGGLGHMAVKFARAFGCEVTAFTSSEHKFDEAREFGATSTLTSTDAAGLQKIAGTLDLLISTINVPIDWQAMIGTLAPGGRIHLVGAVLEPIPVSVIALMMQHRSVSSSPSGSPQAMRKMLDFAARHNITPKTEHLPMSDIHEGFARLAAGKARYRIVLDADF